MRTIVERDARRYGDKFLFADASIRLHGKLGIEEPWNEWEYPRRIAVLDMLERGEELMPRATKKAEPVEEVEEVEELEAETNGKRPYVPRLSLTVTSEMLRNIRIAAALADMDKGEWCTTVLERAADKAVAGSE